MTFPENLYLVPPNLRDEVDVVLAQHVNELRSELSSVQRQLGQDANTASTFDSRDPVINATSGAKFTSLKDRLANIEAAALRDFDYLYVGTAGGGIIRRTSSAPGLTIVTPTSEPTPAIQVLGPGTRTATVRIFGVGGRIEAGSLSTDKVNVGAAEVKVGAATGSATLAGDSLVFDQLSLNNVGTKIRANLTGGEIGLAVDAATAASTPLMVRYGSTEVMRIKSDGSLLVGDLTLSRSKLDFAGVSSLSKSELLLGQEVVLSGTGGLKIVRGERAVTVNDSGLVVRDKGAVVVSLTESGVVFGSTTIRPDEISLTGVGLSAPAGAAFKGFDARLSSDRDVYLVGRGGKISVLSTETLIEATALRIVTGTTTMRVNSTGLEINGSQLSAQGLTLPNGGRLLAVGSGSTTLASTTLQLGVDNKARVVVQPSGVEVYGGLALPDSPTYVWTCPHRELWLGTRPRNNGSASVLRPTYWDNLYLPYASTPLSILGFSIIAPASGMVKLTMQGELGGNVSRSAVTFGIVDVATGNVVLNNGYAQAISVNAPAVDVASDFFYVKTSSTTTARLTPGRQYGIIVKGHRAIPGNDAQAYFPGHPNYGPQYPWGQFFPVFDLQIIVEPMVSAAVPQGVQPARAAEEDAVVVEETEE